MDIEEMKSLLLRANPIEIEMYLKGFVYGYYEDTIEKMNSDEFIDLDELRMVCLLLDKLYGMGKLTPLSDEEYDKLHSIYIDLSGKIIDGSMTNTDRVKVHHDYPDLKGTVKKVHYITESDKANDPAAIKTHKVLLSWFNECMSKLNPNIEHIIGAFPKYNGIAMPLSLNEKGDVIKAITRGDTELGVGTDKTSMFQRYNFKLIIPERYRGKKCGLKTECIMTKPHFKEYNKIYGNNELIDERSAITSLINSLTYTDIHKKYITLKPLMYEVDGVLKSFLPEEDWGPVIYKRIKANDNIDGEFFHKMIDYMAKYIDELDVDCDGVIVRFCDDDAIKTLGRDDTNSVNNFERAYKFAKPSNYTKLIDIEQEIGLLGKVSFTAVFETVKYKNKDINRASLGSLDRMKTLNLAKGDMVNIKYEIIPYLMVDSHCMENKSGNQPISPIDKCPYCGAILEFNPELSCVNEDCPSRVMGKIYNYCKKMNIDTIGESTVEILYHHHLLTSIEDLYSLEDKREIIVRLDGFGDKSFNKMIKAIDKCEVPDYVLLGSIGINGVGHKKFKSVLDIYHLSELMEMNMKDISKLTKVEGIKEKLATKIIEGIDENRDLINFLLDRVNIIKVGKESVVFTGFRNAAFKKHLNKKGIEVSDTVSKKTTLVITNDVNGSSVKLQKARANNIPIIDEHEAYVMFKYGKK